MPKLFIYVSIRRVWAIIRPIWWHVIFTQFSPWVRSRKFSIFHFFGSSSFIWSSIFLWHISMDASWRDLSDEYRIFSKKLILMPIFTKKLIFTFFQFTRKVENFFEIFLSLYIGLEKILISYFRSFLKIFL